VPSATRVAKNESLFREVNERIREISGELFSPDDRVGFVCECSRLECTAVVDVTVGEYLLAREAPVRFLVLPGHVDPEHERVVKQTARYAIVEKVGAAGDVAAAEDDA
jgi:hypothetical protein